MWLSILVFPLAKQEVTISAFTDNGEFALYSAAYVAGTLYILFRDFKSTTNPSFPSKSILGLIFSALLIASAAMFLVVCLFNVIHSTGNDEIPKMLDKQVLRTLSLWVFPISMALSFLVVVTDNVKSSPDVQKVVDGQFNDLNNAFEQLGNPKP